MWNSIRFYFGTYIVFYYASSISKIFILFAEDINALYGGRSIT